MIIFILKESTKRHSNQVSRKCGILQQKMDLINVKFCSIDQIMEYINKTYGLLEYLFHHQQVEQHQ